MENSDKLVVFDAAAREKLLAGVNTLADAVRVTMGPRGRNVLIEQRGEHPIVTKDGVTVAKSINLRDKLQNLGAQMIKEAASRSADEHVAGVRRSIYALEGAIAGAREGWYGSARMVSGIEVPVTDLPLRRWREVEVHMGDLGLAELQCVGPDSWSLDYVRHDLSVMTMQWKSRGSMGLTDLPPQIRTQLPTVRLGWLMGRVTIDGLAPAGLMR